MYALPLLTYLEFWLHPTIVLLVCACLLTTIVNLCLLTSLFWPAAKPGMFDPKGDAS